MEGGLMYEREKAALIERQGDMVEVTYFGGPVQFVESGPGPQDFIACARRAFLRGDLSVEEFEAEIAPHLVT